MDETMVLLLTFSVLLMCCLRIGLASRHYISQFRRWRWLWRECICLFYESISLFLSCTRMWGGLNSRVITVINLDFWVGEGGEGDAQGRGGISWSGSIHGLVCCDDLSEFSSSLVCCSCWCFNCLVAVCACILSLPNESLIAFGGRCHADPCYTPLTCRA